MTKEERQLLIEVASAVLLLDDIRQAPSVTHGAPARSERGEEIFRLRALVMAQPTNPELHLHFHPPEGAVLHGVGDVIKITPAPTPQVPSPAPKVEYQIGQRVQWQPRNLLIGMVRGTAVSVKILDGPKEDGSYIVETGKWGRLKIWPDEILPVIVKRSDAAAESI
jgi:hypothetical protein